MDDIITVQDDYDGSTLTVDASGIYSPHLPLYTAVAASGGNISVHDEAKERIDALEKRVEYLEKLLMDKYMSDMDEL